MNEKQALARLRKILGVRIAWRVNPKALNAEQRESRRVAARVQRDLQMTLQAQRDARRDELLTDPEYVRLRDEAAAARRAADELTSLCYVEPIQVGRVSEGPLRCLHVEAAGDTWDEVVAKIEAKRAPKVTP
jgi:hypothetical protein